LNEIGGKGVREKVLNRPGFKNSEPSRLL